jgi:hypothetical protein
MYKDKGEMQTNKKSQGVLRKKYLIPLTLAALALAATAVLAVAQATPGGITILPGGRQILVTPNPVLSPSERWNVYTDNLYGYTIASPPEWFLTAPSEELIESARRGEIWGLSVTISSVDSSQGPEYEAEVVNKQDVLNITISVDDEPLGPSETLRDFMLRRVFSADQVVAVEDVAYRERPALLVHYSFSGMGEVKVSGLLVLIASKDSRVFRIDVTPSPEETRYADTFREILNSFTILER